MAVDAEGKKPIVVALGLGDLCDADLDALARLSDAYHHQAVTPWAQIHAAVLDERVRRTAAMRSRAGNPGGLAATEPVRLIIPPNLQAHTIENAFNSTRAAYLMIEPCTREATSDGVIARAVAAVLVRVCRGYRIAALRFADAEAVKRTAMARGASTN
jgi:hypothetical protein